MKPIRPYISLDLETTGLAVDKVQILQIGWVIEDGVSPVDKLRKGSIFIANPVITYGEPYAIGMNAWIFQELMKKADQRKYPSLAPAAGLLELMVAIELAADLAFKFDVAQGAKYPKRRVQIAGKNAGNFDMPIVINNINRVELPLTRDMLLEKAKFADHRFIDLGGVFFEDFGRNPGFDEISKLVGMPPINHDALDDAMAVVIALRWKMNQSNGGTNV